MAQPEDRKHGHAAIIRPESGVPDAGACGWRMLGFAFIMTAWTAEEEARKKRRRRLLQGLLVGGAAVGIPALLNAVVAARARRQEPRAWGRTHRYAWDLGDVLFQRLGEGSPVVLLHSFGPGHDSYEWRAAAERLARDHQVFAFDWLGWGRSDRPRLAYEADLYIDLLIDFLLDIVRRRATLVASGLPAAYAIQVAADRPELVRGLALVCPLGLDAGSEEPDVADALLHQLLRAPLLGTSAINLFTTRRALARHLAEELYFNPAGIPGDLLEHLWHNAHAPSGRGALGALLSGYLNHPVATALGRLRTPVLLLWGAESVHPELAAADRWLARLPAAQLAVLADCRALPHAEQPEAFLGRLAPFLDRLPAG